MTIEEFDNIKFRQGMMVEHLKHGERGEIVSVNFEEKLIGYRSATFDEELNWVRCENIKLL